MFLFPVRQQILAADQTAHYPIDVVLGDGLQDDTAELVRQDLDLDTGLNLMLTAKRGRNHRLALRRTRALKSFMLTSLYLIYI